MLYLTIALSNAVFTPRVIIPGVPTVGDNLNITCKLNGVVERLSITPIITLEFIGPPGGTSGEQFRNDLAYFLQQIFNPGMTDDSGRYTCVSRVGAFTSNTSEVLQIKSMVK